ncbi:MAG: SPOR domain-containing protein [bacterium]
MINNSKSQTALVFLGFVIIVSSSFVVGLIWGYHLASSSFEKMLPSTAELEEHLSRRKDITFYEEIKKPVVTDVLKEGEGVYRLQVAAFLEKRKADKLKKRFIREGLEAEVISAKRKKMWYKVQIVGLASRNTAESIKNKVKEMTGMTPFLLQTK